MSRAVPVVEAMAALVIAVAAMIQLSRESAASSYGTMARVNPLGLYKSSKLAGGFSEKEQQQGPASHLQQTARSNGTATTTATQPANLR